MSEDRHLENIRHSVVVAALEGGTSPGAALTWAPGLVDYILHGPAGAEAPKSAALKAAVANLEEAENRKWDADPDPLDAPQFDGGESDGHTSDSPVSQSAEAPAVEAETSDPCESDAGAGGALEGAMPDEGAPPRHLSGFQTEPSPPPDQHPGDVAGEDMASPSASPATTDEGIFHRIEVEVRNDQIPPHRNVSTMEWEGIGLKLHDPRLAVSEYGSRSRQFTYNVRGPDLNEVIDTLNEFDFKARVLTMEAAE